MGEIILTDGPNGNNQILGPVIMPSGQTIPASQIQQVAEMRQAASALLQRIQFFKSHGISYGGVRDLYDILGYDRNVTTSQYRERYLRGGIAGRIVDAPVNATWRGTVEILEDRDPHENTKFEQAWRDLDMRLSVQSKLWRVDKLSQLSNFAVLIIGAGQGEAGSLALELPKGKRQEDVTYISAYSGGGGPVGEHALHRTVSDDVDVTILEYEIDQTSERFGLPKTYQLRRTELSGVLGFQREVHWTRVVHIADGCLFDDVFGVPALERVWNLLDDLDKITGGGAEAFWLRANQGLHLDIAKDMVLPEAEAAKEALMKEAEDYKHQLTRWLRTRGVSVDVLGSDVANFAGPADAVLTQIAGAKAIPKRILTGSEMGELASSQDRDNWKDQVNGRQSQYAGPYILRRLVDRLVEHGYLPPPLKGPRDYEVVWPHIEVLTESEKAQGAAQWAGVNSTQGNPVFTSAEIRDHWYKMEPLDDQQITQEMELKQETQLQPPQPQAAPGAVVEEEEETEMPDTDEEAEGDDDEEEDEKPKKKLKAATDVLTDEETEILYILEAAIRCGNQTVVERILGTL
jgi:hypothetical protein